VSGVLDWEFAAWGGWCEDIEWLTAKCYRFGKNENVTADLDALSDVMAGYFEIYPRKISEEELRYWQVVVNVRWAIVAVQKAE